MNLCQDNRLPTSWGTNCWLKDEIQFETYIVYLFNNFFFNPSAIHNKHILLLFEYYLAQTFTLIIKWKTIKEKQYMNQTT